MLVSLYYFITCFIQIIFFLSYSPTLLYFYLNFGHIFCYYFYIIGIFAVAFILQIFYRFFCNFYIIGLFYFYIIGMNFITFIDIFIVTLSYIIEKLFRTFCIIDISIVNSILQEHFLLILYYRTFIIWECFCYFILQTLYFIEILLLLLYYRNFFITFIQTFLLLLLYYKNVFVTFMLYNFLYYGHLYFYYSIMSGYCYFYFIELLYYSHFYYFFYIILFTVSYYTTLIKIFIGTFILQKCLLLISYYSNLYEFLLTFILLGYFLLQTYLLLL